MFTLGHYPTVITPILKEMVIKSKADTNRRKFLLFVSALDLMTISSVRKRVLVTHLYYLPFSVIMVDAQPIGTTSILFFTLLQVYVMDFKP